MVEPAGFDLESEIMFHGDLSDPKSRRALGLILLAGAGLLVALGVSDLLRVLEVRKWRPVACDVFQSGVAIVAGRRVDRPYRVEVLYRYVWNGQAIIGDRYSERNRDCDTIAEADRRARAYPVGARATCFVDPKDPRESVLVQGGLFDPVGIIVLAAVLFLPPGVYLLVSSCKKRSTPAHNASDERKFMIVGAPFLAIAGIALSGFFADGMVRDVAARRWVRTPCRVIHSEIRSHMVSGGEAHFTAYWADVAYAYPVNGRIYRSNRFNFTERSTPWFYGKRRVVDRYPVGQQVMCYVDPNDPSEAVLSLGWRASTWFVVWPLTLAVFGGWMTLVAWGLVSAHVLQGPLSWRLKQQAGPIAAALAAGFASQLFVVLGSDLSADVRAGKADALEWGVVIVAGLVMAGAMAVFIRVMRATRARSAASNTGLNELHDEVAHA